MSIRRAIPLWLCLLSAAAAPAAAQSSLAVPVGDPVYDELAHFRALGVWNGSLELLPLTRMEVCLAVEEIATRGDELLGADLRRLQGLRRFCAAETSERPGAWLPRTLSREAAAAGFAQPQSYWEPGLAVQFRGGPASVDSIADIDRQPRRQGALFLSLDAEIGGRLSAQLRFYEDYSRLSPGSDGRWVDNMPPDLGGISSDPSARLDLAVLGVDGGWWSLRIGREDRRWGQGRRGTMLLSSNPFPLDGISLRFKSRYLRGASLFAQSRRGGDPPPLVEGVPYDGAAHEAGEAFVAVHRFEVGPFGPATFGLAEAAAFGGRGIDLAYLNPVSFLIPVTQDLFDRSGVDDKKLLCLDVRLDLAPVTWYGEFLLDRYVGLEAATAGDESDISSFGQLIGLRWASPLGLAGADLDVEYAHLDPQVYFHVDGDIRRNYLTEDTLGEGSLIGHWLGPNADDLYARLTLPPSPQWGLLGFEFERARWGLVGGGRGVDVGFLSLDKNEKEWITGEQATERTLAVRWEKRDLRRWTPGTWLIGLRLAHVARGGAWEGEGGWQAELKLRWQLRRRIMDTGRS